MSSLAALISRVLRREPAAVWISMLGTVVATVVHVLHFTPAETAAAGMIATAVGAIITAVRTKPVEITAIASASAIILTAFTAFGLHLDSGAIAEVTAAESMLLGLLLGVRISPTAPA